jgi:hypothetical protein
MRSTVFSGHRLDGRVLDQRLDAAERLRKRE